MNAFPGFSNSGAFAANVSRNLSKSANLNVNAGSGFSAPSEGFDFKQILSGWGGILVVILVLMVVMAIYYQTIGYYVQMGWEKLSWSRSRGERVEIEVPGTGISAELQPAMAPPSGSKGSSLEGSLSSAINTLETDVESALGMGVGGGKQVFNVNRNIYTFGEAEPLCRAFGAELATYDQVKDAYESGADWCNYGWVKGQMAIYPTQKDTYEKLQHGPESERMSCGRPGVNGGYFPNAEQRFGVTCYGARPAESALDERIQMEEHTDTSFDREVNHFKAELDSIAVTPWNGKQWSN